MKSEVLSKKKLFFMLLFSPLLMGIIGSLVLSITGQHPIPHPSNPFRDSPFMVFIIGVFGDFFVAVYLRVFILYNHGFF